MIGIRFAPPRTRRPVRFELIGGLVVFPARVAGRDVWAILDNRVDQSLIDSGLARAAGLATGDPIAPLVTPTGTLPRRPIARAIAEIPGQMTATGAFSAVDLGFPSRMVGRRIGLVIGREYFRELQFLISFGRREFQLGPSGSLRIPATVPLVRFDSDRPTLRLGVGAETLSVTLDLGYNGSLAVGEAGWRKLGEPAATHDGTSSAGLEGAIFRVRSAQLSNVRLGPVRRASVPVTIRPIFADDADGLVGTGLFAGHDIAIDIRAGRMWITPSRPGPTPG